MSLNQWTNNCQQLWLAKYIVASYNWVSTNAASASAGIRASASNRPALRAKGGRGFGPRIRTVALNSTLVHATVA